LRIIKLIIKRILIGVALALTYLIIGVSIIFNMKGSTDSEYFTFVGFWLLLGIILLIFTPMRYALIFTVFFGIGTDMFSDIGADASIDLSTAVSTDPSISQDISTMMVTGDGSQGIHHVEAHWVEGYVKADGTVVEGYWRDGDGNPATNLSSEQGGGYIRSNPDGNPFNNLKK
jgi:hypothetical protein